MEETGRNEMPISRLASAVLGLFAAPRLNIREDYEKVRRLQRVLSWVPRDPERIQDHVVESPEGHDIPVRVFLPRERARNGVLLFFHGGGWAIGDVDTYTAACRTMADVAGQAVVSVDYRLAPEHPYPAGLKDCLHVTETLLGDPSLARVGSPQDVTLIGDSAGGNLVAAVTLALRETGRTLPGAQILLYPVTQWDHDPDTSPFQSVRDYGTGLRLTSAEVRDYITMYQPNQQMWTQPLISPLAEDDLGGLPRTLVVTAGLDLLRDEGEAFGEALRAAGTPARVERIDGALHGFIMLPRFARPLVTAYEHITSFLDGDDSDSRALDSPVTQGAGQ